MGNGIVTSLFEKRYHPSNEPPEWWGKQYGALETLTGVSVTPETSMQISAVYACVNVLAQTVAMLPLILYRRLPRGKERAPDHSLFNLLRNLPNPEMTAMDMRMALQGHLALRGNAYAEIVTDGAGRIREIWPLRPDKMNLTRNPAGDLVYEYTLPAKYNYEKKYFRMEQIWQKRGLSSIGLIGLSPIQQAMQAAGIALAAEGYGGRFFANDAKPGFVLSHPGKLSEQAYERLKKSWENRHRGYDNAHRVAILEEGMEPKKIGITPEEAQYIQTRNFQAKEIARFYRMPPHKIGIMDDATFTNIEHQALEFLTDTIMPYLTIWEQSIYRCLLLERERSEYFAEHLLDSLLRGDTLSRYQAYQAGIQSGWLTRNEVRERENLNPKDGLDEPLQPLNMATIGQMDALDGSGDDDPNSESDGEDERGLRHYSSSPVIDPAEQTVLAAKEIEERSKKSAQTRHRLQRSYRRIYQDAAGRIIRREVNDVGNQARKILGGRDSSLFLSWMSEFYREHEEFIKRQLTPVARTYMELVGEAAGEEVGKQAAEADVERFTKDYMDYYASRHAGRSAKRVRDAVNGAIELNEDPLPAVEAELEGWSETRPESIANEETVRANNAVSKLVYTLAGITKIASVAFGDNCPYCTALDGKIIEIKSNFLDAGMDFLPDGATAPLTVSSSKGHAPYHKGCDCGIMAVIG